MYFNTTGHTGRKLEQKRKTASTQDVKVLWLIKKYIADGKTLTARRVWWAYRHHSKGNIQLTSVRRSINTLVNNGTIKYGARLQALCPIEKFKTTEKTIILCQL